MQEVCGVWGGSERLMPVVIGVWCMRVGSAYVVGLGIGKHWWWTNVDALMLVSVVERDSRFVVWCGDGNDQLEISGA